MVLTQLPEVLPQTPTLQQRNLTVQCLKIRGPKKISELPKLLCPSGAPPCGRCGVWQDHQCLLEGRVRERKGPHPAEVWPSGCGVRIQPWMRPLCELKCCGPPINQGNAWGGGVLGAWRSLIQVSMEWIMRVHSSCSVWEVVIDNHLPLPCVQFRHRHKCIIKWDIHSGLCWGDRRSPPSE